MPFTTKEWVIALAGMGLITSGAVISIFWMDIYNHIIAQKLVLQEGSESYEAWKSPPLELNLDIYFFNWTNPTNFTTDGFEKPILKEIGPYRFREKTTKKRIRLNSNSTVSYRKRSVYHFVPEESKGSLDDIIVTMNVVAISAANTVRDRDYLAQKEVSMGLNLYNQQVFVVKEARELLFDGYQDDLIDMARYLSKVSFRSSSIPYDRFGWFYKRNGSDDFGGYFNIHTGKDNIHELGVVKNWNYQPETKYYKDDCNKVRGSGGELFPPGQTKDKPISIFSGDLCRPLDLFFTEELNKNGLKVFKYSSTEQTLDNGQKYAENKCFSLNNDILPGVMNISACRFGAPVFVSMPHFYAADHAYLNFSGLNPSADKHAFYIALDPNTGIPVEVAARLQINIFVEPFPNIGIYQEAPRMFFPAIWFEQKVQIPKEVIDDLRIAASVPAIGYVCCVTLIIIGLCLFIFIGCSRLRTQKNTQNVSSNEKKNGATTIYIPKEKFIGKAPEQAPLVLQKPLTTFGDVGSARRAPLSTPEDFDSIGTLARNS